MAQQIDVKQGGVSLPPTIKAINSAKPGSLPAHLAENIPSQVQTDKTLPQGSVRPVLTSELIAWLKTPEAEQFIKILSVLLEHEAADPLPISGGAAATEDCIADISYLGRELAGLFSNSPVFQAIGITTGENAFMGLYAAYKAWLRGEEASKIGDTGGRIESAIDKARGIAQGIGGGFFVGYRSLEIVCSILGVNSTMSASTVLGKTAFGIGVIGNIFFVLYYGLIGLWGACHLPGTVKFYSNLATQSSQEAKFKFLADQVQTNTKATLKEAAKWDEPKSKTYKSDLQEKALKELTQQFLKVQGKIAKKGDLKLDRETIESNLKKFFILIDQYSSKNFKRAYLEKLNLTEADTEKLSLNSLEVFGLKVQEDYSQKRKDTQIGRIVGGNASELIKKAIGTGLAERLGSKDAVVKAAAEKEAVQLEKSVRSMLIKNLIIYSGFVLTGVLGVISVIAFIGFFTLPTGWFIGLTALTFVLIGVMCGLDFYSWITGTNSGRPGKYDKLFIAIAGAIMAAALVVSAVLTFGFGFPVAAFMMGLAIGFPALALAVFSYYKIGKLEQKWLADHPDLNQYLEKMLKSVGFTADAEFKKLSTAEKKNRIKEALNNQELKADLAALYKKLPKADRQRIKEMFIDLGLKRDLKLKEVRTLDANGDFSGDNVIKATEDLENAAQLKTLKRACKKTCKTFWKQAQVTQKESDRTQAEQIQHFYDLTKQVKKGEITEGLRASLKTQLDQLQSHKDVLSALNENMFFIQKREESALDLADVILDLLDEKKNPKQTLDRFLEKLGVLANKLGFTNKNEELDERVLALYKKLPKSDRNLIKDTYMTKSGNGQLNFKNARYAALNKRNDFGREYLEKVLSNSFADKGEYQLLLSAFKRTEKDLLERVARADGNDKMRAQHDLVNFQDFYRLVSDYETWKNTSRGQIDLIKNAETAYTYLTETAYECLTKNIWFTVKKRESAADLILIIQAVQQKKKFVEKLIKQELTA